MRRTDLLVIGGGVIGYAVALRARRRGASVRLVAAGPPPATSAAAGMLCPSFEELHQGGSALATLAGESLALWDEFAAGLCAEPARTLGYDRGGVLGVGFPKGVLRGEVVEVPDGIEASGAVLVAGEGQVDPRLLLVALRERCEEEEVEIVRGKAGSLSGGEAVSGATLPDGNVEAGVTVLASGMEAFDLPLGLKPVRGRAFSVRVPHGLSRVLRTPSVYFCPKAEGLLYVGATEEERDMPAAPDALWHEACWIMPALRDAQLVEVYDGVRPSTGDGLPIVGAVPGRTRLIAALGHGRNGVLLAPSTARRVVEAAGL